MEVKSGYKQTEVGVIPDQWDCLKIRDAAAKSANAIVGGPFGSDLVSADYEAFGTPVIRGQNMSASVVSGEFVFVSPRKAKALSANLSRPFDLVFTQRGTLGQVSLVPDGAFEQYLISQSQMKVSLDRTRHDPRFVRQYFASDAGQKQILTSAIQTGVPHTNLGILRAYLIPAPPLSEQRAIAAALSDVDALLGGLDRLIAKKRDLKQAAMQQLLTGQTRLPGFSGAWEVKRLGDVAEMEKGAQLHSSETNAEGDFPHLNGGIFASSYTHKANTPANTIAISEGGNSCGYVQFISEPFWCGGHCYAVVPKDVEKPFLYHALKGQQSAIMGLRVGSGLPNVQKTALAAFKLNLPSNSLEQTAIAAVLSDMDAELAALEARRDKTRDLKQAVMQELLTGKTRLVKPEVAHA